MSSKDQHGYSNQDQIPEGHLARVAPKVKVFQVPDQSQEEKEEVEFLRNGTRPDKVTQGAGMGYTESPLTSKNK